MYQTFTRSLPELPDDTSLILLVMRTSSCHNPPPWLHTIRHSEVIVQPLSSVVTESHWKPLHALRHLRPLKVVTPPRAVSQRSHNGGKSKLCVEGLAANSDRPQNFSFSAHFVKRFTSMLELILFRVATLRQTRQAGNHLTLSQRSRRFNGEGAVPDCGDAE